jgi:hypothetical protein
MSTKTETTKADANMDKIATTLATTEKAFADLEGKFSGLTREIRNTREAHEAAQEERRRLSAQWDYEEEQRRRVALDRQRDEDREREQKHVERTTALAQNETVFREMVSDIFGIPTMIDFDAKKARAALDKKIADAESKGKAIAETQAKKDYETAKKISDAEAATKLALLEAENKRLTADNASLKAANDKLSEQQNTLATRMGDLSTAAFAAAGGMTSKANDALSTAASGVGMQRTR